MLTLLAITGFTLQGCKKTKLLKHEQAHSTECPIGSTNAAIPYFSNPSSPLLTRNSLLRKIKHMKLTFFSPSLPLLLFVSLLISSCGSDANKKQVSTETQQESIAGKKTILFFGNSLSAGYGIEPELSFPGRTQSRLDSLKKDFKVINGGLSGETTAGGLSRLDWFLEEEPYLFVLELGGNDGLRGIAISETKKNLLAIVDKVQAKYPNTKIILAGMQIPPNMGQAYTDAFKAIYPAVAKEKNITLIPFLLEGVAGNPALNLPDGIHPTEEGHRLVFETIWPFILAEL